MNLKHKMSTKVRKCSICVTTRKYRLFFTMCLERKKSAFRLGSSTAASSTTLCGSCLYEKARCAARKHLCDDQADSDSINHVTFQIFSNSSFQKSPQQQKKKKREVGAFKRKRISMYLTPTTALARPLYTHLTLPSAIHRGLMMLQSGRLRLYGGEGKRQRRTAREGGAEG